ncbi:hypothetical protein ACWGCW_35685 [Streptomyces sp. NPDC054933]|jgi:hypothetical protein
MHAHIQPTSVLSHGVVQLADGPIWGPITVTITATVVGALLSIVTASFQDWRLRRSEGARRRQAIEDACRYLELIDRWLTMYGPISNKAQNEEAEAWAACAMRRTMEGIPEPVERIPPPKHERVWKLLRRKFLLFKPGSAAEAIFQMLFYFFTAFGIFAFFSVVAVRGSWGDKIGSVLFVIVVFGALAYLLRYFAMVLRRRTVDQDVPERSNRVSRSVRPSRSWPGLR